MAKVTNPFEFDSEEEAIKALEAEGRRLKYIAIKLWRKYLSEYKPKEYIRTRDSQKAIKLGRVKPYDEDTYCIELTFDNDLSYHDSWFTKKGVAGNHKKGHSFMLISEGWKVKKGKHKDRYRFGYFEGIDYISRVKEAFEKGKHQGITLEVQWVGAEFKKQPEQKNVLR